MKLINEYMLKNGYAMNQWNTTSQSEILSRANDFAREKKTWHIFFLNAIRQNPPTLNAT